MRKRFCWLFVALCANAFIANPIARGAERQRPLESAAKTKSTAESIEIREFEVRVDNNPRGVHRLTIKSEGGNQKVEFQTDVKVDVIVYAYVFKFRGTEMWRDGRVEETDIQCEDGGKKRAFSLKTDGAIQQASFNGKPLQSPARVAMTTAYWKLPSAPRRAKSLQIVDVDTGQFHEANLNHVGPDKVEFGDHSLACQHFKIDGPSPAELWFDDQDCLVRQKALESGHLMELKLKQIRISKDGH